MFTNRDEVLEKALRIFAKMNYEKASQMEIAKTCGLYLHKNLRNTTKAAVLPRKRPYKRLLTNTNPASFHL